MDTKYVLRDVYGFRYLNGWIDHFSKYLILAPSKDLFSETVLTQTINRVYLKYGCPEKYIVDNASNINDTIQKELNYILGTNLVNTSPYYSKSNGIIENVWKFIDRLIRLYGYKDWSTYTDWLMYLWNSEGKMDIDGYSPNHMIFGSLNVIPTFKISNLVNIREYKEDLPWLKNGKLLVSKWIKKLDLATEELLKRVQQAKDKYYIKQDRRYSKQNIKNIIYKPGDLVKVRISFGLFEKQLDNWNCGYIVLEDLKERVKVKEIDSGKIIVVNKNFTRPLVKDEWKLNTLLQDYRDKIINKKILFKKREGKENNEDIELDSKRAEESKVISELEEKELLLIDSKAINEQNLVERELNSMQDIGRILLIKDMKELSFKELDYLEIDGLPKLALEKM